jgi:hypothetical protein
LRHLEEIFVEKKKWATELRLDTKKRERDITIWNNQSGSFE